MQNLCLNEDKTPPICKHWLRKRSCIYKSECLFLHPPVETLPSFVHTIPRHGNRQRKRVYNDGRVGALRRWMLNTFGKEYLSSGTGVIDVAGGKGELSFEIYNLNGIKSTVFDPRPMELRRFIRKLEFGYYHRNSILNSYNNTPKDSPIVIPFHIRGFFQLSNSYEICAFNNVKSEEINIPKMLLDEEIFNNCIQFSLNTFWSTKGLQHEDDDNNNNNNDSDNNNDNDSDNQEADEIEGCCLEEYRLDDEFNSDTSKKKKTTVDDKNNNNVKSSYSDINNLNGNNDYIYICIYYFSILKHYFIFYR